MWSNSQNNHVFEYPWFFCSLFNFIYSSARKKAASKLQKLFYATFSAYILPWRLYICFLEPTTQKVQAVIKTNLNSYISFWMLIQNMIEVLSVFCEIVAWYSNVRQIKRNCAKNMKIDKLQNNEFLQKSVIAKGSYPLHRP